MSELFKKSVLQETEADRLQKEVDSFTHKIEHQRRRNMSLEVQAKDMDQQVRVRRAVLQKTLPSINKEKEIQYKLKHLEGILNREIVLYNTINTANNKLREQINTLRREKRVYLKRFSEMEQKLQKQVEDTEEYNKAYQASIYTHQRDKAKLLHLKAKAEEEFEEIHNQVSSMRNAMAQDEKLHSTAIKEVETTMRQWEKSKNNQDLSDPVKALNAIYKKWVNACMEKRNAVEQYQKSIKVLTEAFSQIKEATGIEDIEEVVTGFVKSEEQSHNLYTFLNLLNTELDDLEGQQASLMKQQELIKQTLEDKVNGNQNQIQLAHQHKAFLKEQDRQAKAEIAMFKQDIASLFEPIEEVIGELEGKGFKLDVSNKILRDEVFTVNDSNVQEYLGELEDYTAGLIRVLAYQQGEQAPEFANVSNGMEKFSIGMDKHKIKQILNEEETLNFLQTRPQFLRHSIDESMDDEEGHPMSRDQFIRISKNLYNSKITTEDPILPEL